MTRRATTVISAGGRPVSVRVKHLRLDVVDGPNAGASAQLAGRTLSIGADPVNELVLSDSSVSRFHCRIVAQDSGYRQQGHRRAPHSLRNEHRDNLIFAVVIGLVTVWTGYVRAAGLDPHSLWYDDLWVASVVKLDSLFEAVSLPVPAPPAFRWR